MGVFLYKHNSNGLDLAKINGHSLWKLGLVGSSTVFKLLLPLGQLILDHPVVRPFRHGTSSCRRWVNHMLDVAAVVVESMIRVNLRQWLLHRDRLTDRQKMDRSVSVVLVLPIVLAGVSSRPWHLAVICLCPVQCHLEHLWVFHRTATSLRWHRFLDQITGKVRWHRQRSVSQRTITVNAVLLRSWLVQ